MMKKLALLTSLIFATVIYAQQATIRIGYVDSQVILQQLPEAQRIQKELDNLLQKYQNELDQMTKTYQSKVEEYQKKEAMLNQQAKEQMQREILELEQKIYEYRAQKLGPQGEFEMEREKRLKPLRDKIIDAIEDVAREEKLNFVFDKAGDVILLYADKQFDITYKVLDKLTRGAKSK
ncbi:OmpH family outer membrane protein [Candidatus Chrysopegis kryptomonas]|uniref:Periplasmic chaperone for outer membrane proteins Skp n=1 Tax=Candidatus Chryseopegocella kryptomonas TaxID=1633643 RepID=A0A0P1P0R2_9BACT|nr:OmpH family outer membrane protein [Candidatus Chrysopegis kryptomonas]CUT05525.1 periplasmic chaperone for outer membrane proteins Skp [Candidatus Chrysopegis kryptomonas]